MSLTPGTTLGPHAVTAKIGEGGMGEVWQATDTKLNRQVALKIRRESVPGATVGSMVPPRRRPGRRRVATQPRVMFDQGDGFDQTCGVQQDP